MYLKKQFIKKTGRTYLSIAKGYRNQKGISTSKIVLSLGYLDELEQSYDDPIAHFQQVAAQMTLEEKQTNEISLSLNMKETLSQDSDNLFYFGSVVLSKIYHDLQLHEFFANAQRRRHFKFSANNIMKLLVYTRVLMPNSKKANFEIKQHFVDASDFSLDDIYNSLSFFADLKERCILWINERMKDLVQEDHSVLLYDVTNYNFESPKQTSLRKKGFAKKHTTNPIIQTGLVTDLRGLPITYRLFPGNTHDSKTYTPILLELKENLKAKRIIIVADKGLNGGDNIAHNILLGFGYVLGEKVRGGTQELLDFILDPAGYSDNGKDEDDSEYAKVKSRLIPRRIKVTTKEGKKKEVSINQKQVIRYSTKYAKRSRQARNEKIEKAKTLIKNPESFDKQSAKGLSEYIINLEFNAETGVIIEKQLLLNVAKIIREEQLDGYYLYVSSETKTSDQDIINMYHQLYKIEHTFRATKSTIETSPIYLSTDKHIEGHFLTCYIALTILRILEIQLESTASIDKIVDTLKQLTCSYLQENVYSFHHRSELSDQLGNLIGVNLSLKYRTLKDIKDAFAYSKKYL